VVESQDDPRLLEWLQLVLAVLQSPAEELFTRLENAHARRAELARSLEQSPANPAPSAELASALREHEAALAKLADQVLVEVRARIEELRRVRGGTQGYRPSRVDVPAYLSRKA
jgi:hypothetical protein